MLNFIAAAKKNLSTAFHRFIRRRLMAELAIADEGLLDKLLNPPSENRQPILFSRGVDPFSRSPPPSTPLHFLQEQLHRLHRLEIKEVSVIIAARL